MKTISKFMVVLCVLVMALALTLVFKAKTANTETFIHKSPDFTLSIPNDWIKCNKSINPNCILRLKLKSAEIPASEPVSSDINCVLRMALNSAEIPSLEAAVWVPPQGKTYKESVKDLINLLEDKNQASNCQILYEREIKLKDGTPAYEQEVKWNHPMILLYTYRLVVFKDKQEIDVSVTNTAPVSDQLKQIPLSIAFK